MGHAYLPDKPLKHDRPPIVPDTPTASKRGSELDDLAAAEHRCASPEPLPVFSRGGGVLGLPDADEEGFEEASTDTVKVAGSGIILERSCQAWMATPSSLCCAATMIDTKRQWRAQAWSSSVSVRCNARLY